MISPQLPNLVVGLPPMPPGLHGFYKGILPFFPVRRIAGRVTYYSIGCLGVLKHPSIRHTLVSTAPPRVGGVYGLGIVEAMSFAYRCPAAEDLMFAAWTGPY